MLVLVGLCVSAFIYFNVVPAHDNPVAQKSISLTDVLDNKFYARHNNATWISDTELLFKDAQVSTLI